MAKKILGYVKLQVTPAPPPLRRPSGRPWASAASTSWASARSSTPAPRTCQGHAPADGDHRLSGQELHLRHQDAAGHPLPQGGRRHQDRAPARPGRETVGSITRTQLREIAEEEDEGPRTPHDIEAAARIIEGSARAMGLAWWRLSMSKIAKRVQAWTGDRAKPYPLAEAVKLVKENATGEVRRDRRDRRQPGRRSAPRRPAGPRRGLPAVRHRPRRARRGDRQGRQGRPRPRPPAPTSSAPRIWSSASRAASWSSTG